MDRLNRTAAATCGIGLLLMAAPCAAEAPLPNIWNAIGRADARIRASHVRWEVTVRYMPESSSDPQRAAAQALAAERAAGKSEAEAQVAAQTVGTIAQHDKQGYTLSQSEEYEYDGKSVRCDAAGGAVAASNGAAFRSAGSGYTDIFDGSNDIHVERATTGEGAGSRAFLQGDVSPSGSGFLSTSAGSKEALIWLVGAPVGSVFKPGSTVVIANTKRSVILQRLLITPPRQDGPPVIPRIIDRLTLDAKTWRPVRQEHFVPQGMQLISLLSIGGYRDFGRGVWFPTIITNSLLMRSGRPVQVITYRLVSAQFNEDADLEQLRQGVPHGVRMVDHRFASAPPVAYILNHQLPTDDEIRQLIRLDREWSISALKGTAFGTVRIKSF